MNPTFSVIFLTTLIGVGQGLFFALFASQSYGMVNVLPPQPSSFYAGGGLIALLFMMGGLFAAVFHLGKPSYFFTRAWRGITQWRTSWLSRELIAMPLVMFMLFVYILVNWFGLDVDLYGWGMPGQVSLTVGIVTATAVLGLFVSRRATGTAAPCRGRSSPYPAPWGCRQSLRNARPPGSACRKTAPNGCRRRPPWCR